ncbi:energy transducer TonB [Bradyrhizobium prioriisuperbiae]|uniref:energy transducer TonB family protein n=1 Tax=Bradyrhizobium prioriisuperbiae TaxID=2854389 RepID=UPI0028E22720|nr:energy transducer TonB [Bradyrhizobium prioritasuperba]
MGEVLRLFLVPTIAAVLFVGGIYWVRQQLPAGPTGQDRASVVQVRLLPRSDPAPIPVGLESPPIAASVANRTDVPIDPSDSTAISDLTVTQPARDSTPAEIAAPSVRPTPSPADAPPSSAAIRFQQALLRHVARYQRYPNAARLGRLQGSVETLFSMRRDGTLLGVWVKTSSGQAVLDSEAVDAIRRAQPLPSIPSGLPDRLNIRVTLVFEPS